MASSSSTILQLATVGFAAFAVASLVSGAASAAPPSGAAPLPGYGDGPAYAPQGPQPSFPPYAMPAPGQAMPGYLVFEPPPPRVRYSEGMMGGGIALIVAGTVGLIAGSALIASAGAGNDYLYAYPCVSTGCTGGSSDSATRAGGIAAVALGTVALGGGIAMVVIGSRQVIPGRTSATLEVVPGPFTSMRLRF